MLRARDLVVRAPIGAPVLRCVGFDLPAGRVLGLVGESGAGKSMVGRAVAGLLPDGFVVESGSLTFDGEDLVRMPPARRRALLGRRIGFVPQLPMTALNPVRSIGAQMTEHLAHAGLPHPAASRAERRHAAAAALEEVGLPDAALLGRHPHQLSGGMCQRVLIAMAFASRPALVVADEPTTALDASSQGRVLGLIRGLQARHGTAVLFITHDLRLARDACDEVAVMYAGAIVEHGPANAVLDAPAHPYARCLSLANPPLAPAERPATRGLLVLADQAPGLADLARLSGCRFAPRCPVAGPSCAAEDPVLRPGVGGRRVACHFPSRTPGIAAPELAPPPPLPAGPALLEAQGLTRVFRTGPAWARRTVVAVQDVSLHVPAGSFTGLVGESGSGKSTLARIVAGLDRPTSGTLRRAAAQLVFQDPLSALNPRRRVGSIVTQAIEGRAPAALRQRRALELLAELGLAADLAPRRPGQLSGGQRQRVNIARALCVTPALLVADEIASGLDVSVQAQLVALLRRLRAEHGFGLLFVSHDLALVRHLCERVAVMQGGRLIEAGETAEVFAAPAHPGTRALLAACGMA